MKLGMDDTRARGYTVMDQILNICINLVIRSKGSQKYRGAVLAERL